MPSLIWSVSLLFLQFDSPFPWIMGWLLKNIIIGNKVWDTLPDYFRTFFQMPEHYPLLGNPQSQALSIEHDGREDRERSIGNSTCAPVLTQPGQ